MLDIGTEIPEDHVTQKGCFFGVTGTGKSNGAGVLLEEYHKKNLPYVMIDIAGAHWGIAEKYNVTIWGGKKGLPLDPDRGEDIARQIVDNNINNAILDLSEWNDFEMQIFCGDFARMMFSLHEIKRVPRHIFVEEAEVLCPQVGYDKSKHSLLAFNRIMKRGRAFGLGMTLISQRPQDVNKKTLSQVQVSFLLHLEGIKEIDVVREIFRNEDKDTRKAFVDSILSAKKGECLLYSPQWLGKTLNFKFRKRETFHAGYTPVLGVEVNEPDLPYRQTAPILLTEEPKPVKENKNDKKIMAYAVIFGVFLYLLSVMI